MGVGYADFMQYTVDHEFIRQWIETSGGLPAIRVGSLQPNGAHIEISWTKNNPDATPIGWGEFFEWFEAENLAFGYPDDQSIDPRYFEFASRDDVPASEPSMHAEDHIAAASHDPFADKKEWQYDKPHRD